MPAGTLTLALPQGWTSTPASIQVPAVSPGSPKTFSFSVAVGPANGTRSARIAAELSGDDWKAGSSAAVGLNPCVTPPTDRAVVAWDPTSGTTVTDSSGSGRNANVVGTATYDTTAPSGSGLVLNGSTYLTTASTLLGYMPEATFAAEVKIGGPATGGSSTPSRAATPAPTGSSSTSPPPTPCASSAPGRTWG